MLFSCQAVVLATLAFEGVTALPSHHHVHRHLVRDLADVLGKRTNWSDPANYKGVDWTKLNYGDSPASPAAGGASDVHEHVAKTKPSTAPESSAPASSGSGSGSGSSSGGSGSCVDISQVWKKGDTSKSGPTAAGAGSPWTDASTKKSKRATAAQDGFVGNTGSPYGTNIVPLSDCNDQSHDYSIKFTNKYGDKRDMAVMIWNKVGADGQPQSGPSSNSFFMIDLPAGKSASFAFEANSQIAFSESSETCQRQSGAPGDWYCIWGEANFGPPGGGWTSWDASLMLDTAVPGEVEISLPGQDNSASSRSKCGFTNAGQQSAGAGTGETCNPNTSGKANLEANFGS